MKLLEYISERAQLQVSADSARQGAQPAPGGERAQAEQCPLPILNACSERSSAVPAEYLKGFTVFSLPSAP